MAAQYGKKTLYYSIKKTLVAGLFLTQIDLSQKDTDDTLYRYMNSFSKYPTYRERVSTALESSGSMLYTTASDALHCTC